MDFFATPRPAAGAGRLVLRVGALEIELDVELHGNGTSASQLPRFRARACRTDGSRPTTFVVASSCEAEAHQEVLAHLGDGWKLTELQPA